jgi:hypothetical protein
MAGPNTDYPEVIHLPVTRTGDNYIMFLGEKELITDSDRTSLLGLRISAALPVALGCNFAFDVLFFILELILPAVRRWGRG